VQQLRAEAVEGRGALTQDGGGEDVGALEERACVCEDGGVLEEGAQPRAALQTGLLDADAEAGLGADEGFLHKLTYTVVAISIRSSKFRTGLFNDDRLAGQFKLRTDFADFWNRRSLGQLKFRIELIGQAARLLGAVNSLARGAGRAGGGTAGPAGPPRSLIAVCVASVSPVCAARKIVCLLDFLAREDRPNAVSALNSQGEEPPAETQPPTCPNFFGVFL
jgi:hypothetical protein